MNNLKDPDVVTNAEALRVAAAFVATFKPGVDPATLSNEQKAGLFLFKLRQHILDLLRTAEVKDATDKEAIRVAPGATIALGNDGDIP